MKNVRVEIMIAVVGFIACWEILKYVTNKPEREHRKRMKKFDAYIRAKKIEPIT